MDLPDTFLYKELPNRTSIWIIDKYMDIGVGRTVIGELIFQIKYAKNLRQTEYLKNIVRHSILQLLKFPDGDRSLREIDAVVSVPPSSESINTLPQTISQIASDVLNVPDWTEKLTRVSTTGPSKFGHSATSSMYATESTMTDKRLLILDDVFRTGSTLDGLATFLRQKGARSIVGLCLAKADKGMI